MPEPRPVFYVSDGTGITAETIGHSVLTQFAGTRFRTDRIPFVDGPARAREVARRIRTAGETAGLRPIVISSCVDAQISALLAESGALLLDVFAPFIHPLETELGQPRQRHVGKAHGMVDFERYHQRINAIDFSITHDDGMSINYSQADVILVGVSRAGKTPTCLYLAMHHGVRAANYPLTDEDMEHDQLPPRLRAYRSKLFGLTIDPARLQQIRQERRPGSHYADGETCKHEVSAAERLFRAERIPMLSTTYTSIEEIASKVMATFNIQRNMY